tara:strand:- start:25184 stop:26122 length:939 start_codon:yes stop_codon:yes gene_type:complete
MFKLGLVIEELRVSILAINPWREQFFNKYTCPENIDIPIHDPDAYKLNPKHSWVYNKLLITEKQNISCGPHGIEPDIFPVFSKPIYNLKSLGFNTRLLQNQADYHEYYEPGCMWSTFYKGEHISTDVSVINGEIQWCCHTIGYPLQDGTFDYWEIQKSGNKRVKSYLQDFIHQHLSGYTGMLNAETIDCKIIEIHLRSTSQWPDLYGNHFIQSVIDLYVKKTWQYKPNTNTGYSVVLFDEHKQYRKPSADFISKFIDGKKVSSIQLPFDESISFAAHSMPPGGFRLAIINGFCLDSCLRVREAIHQEYKKIN